MSTTSGGMIASDNNSDRYSSDDEETEKIDISALSFEFRGEPIPVTTSATVTPGEAQMALECRQFTTWVARCEQTYGQKLLKMHSVEIQSVDPFGARYVINYLMIHNPQFLWSGGG